MEAKTFTKEKKDHIEKREKQIVADRLDSLTKNINDSLLKLAKDFFDRGNIKNLDGDVSGAISDYKQAINMNPDHTSTYNNLGYCHVRMGEYELAIRYFTDSIRITPSQLNYYNRALAYEVLGENLKSQQDREAAKRLPLSKYTPTLCLHLADEYYQHAEKERKKENFYAAAVYYSECIRIRPEEILYRERRATAYEVLGESKKAQEDQEAVDEFKAAKQALSPQPSSDAKYIRSFPGAIVELIGKFLSPSSNHNFYRISKNTQQRLSPLLQTSRHNQLEAEWRKLKESKAHIHDLGFLEDLPPQLAKDDERRVQLLQHLIKEKYFALIHYLVQQKVDINATWEEVYTYQGYRKVHDDVQEVTRTGHRTHSPLDSLRVSKFDAITVFNVINLGFQVLNYGFKYIIPAAIAVLKDTNKYNQSEITAAGELLIIAFERQQVQQSDIKQIMEVARHIQNPVIKQIEATFLVDELTSLLPSKWNLIADRTDSENIEATIDALKKIIAKKPIADEDIAELQKIKRTIADQSYPAKGEPRNLYCHLLDLKKKGLVTFQSRSKTSVNTEPELEFKKNMTGKRIKSNSELELSTFSSSSSSSRSSIPAPSGSNSFAVSSFSSSAAVVGNFKTVKNPGADRSSTAEEQVTEVTDEHLIKK